MNVLKANRDPKKVLDEGRSRIRIKYVITAENNEYHRRLVAKIAQKITV